MMAMYVLAVLLTLPLAHAAVTELRHQLNLQFLDPNPCANPPSYAVDIEAQLNYLFYSLTCKSPNNAVTVRISPNDQTTDFIDKVMQLSDKTPGVRNCFPLGQPPPVNCSKGVYCETSNVCDVSLISVCLPTADSNSWQMTQYLDIEMSVDQNRLHIVKCLAACGDAGDVGGVSDADSFSDYAIGAIAAVAVVFAVFGLVMYILWHRQSNGRERAFADPKKRMVAFAT